MEGWVSECAANARMNFSHFPNFDFRTLSVPPQNPLKKLYNNPTFQPQNFFQDALYFNSDALSPTSPTLSHTHKNHALNSKYEPFIFSPPSFYRHHQNFSLFCHQKNAYIKSQNFSRPHFQISISELRTIHKDHPHSQTSHFVFFRVCPLWGR